VVARDRCLLVRHGHHASVAVEAKLPDAGPRLNEVSKPLAGRCRKRAFGDRKRACVDRPCLRRMCDVGEPERPANAEVEQAWRRFREHRFSADVGDEQSVRRERDAPDAAAGVGELGPRPPAHEKQRPVLAAIGRRDAGCGAVGRDGKRAEVRAHELLDRSARAEPIDADEPLRKQHARRVRLGVSARAVCQRQDGEEGAQRRLSHDSSLLLGRKKRKRAGLPR
jgi:hypothetical protein